MNIAQRLAVYGSLGFWCVTSVPGQTIEWTRQFGTAATDFGYDVTTDGLGNVYATGTTGGDLGAVNAGYQDVFLRKYDTDGLHVWTRQLGGDDSDIPHGVAADGQGNVYVSGYTYGSLGLPSVGESDVFLSKYDASGGFQWTRQFGGTDFNYGRGLAVDELGDIYVSGYSRSDPFTQDFDGFVSKYDGTGTQQWIQWISGSVDDRRYGVSADGQGNIYVTGVTEGNLGAPHVGGRDVFLRKYDTNGSLQWTRQFGSTDHDWGRGVSADGQGNVYVSGWTEEDLFGTSAGDFDAFVSKYDADGVLQWNRQLSTSERDQGRDISADGLGNVYISGQTGGSLGGNNAGGSDAFVGKYDDSGGLEWLQQLGTGGGDLSYGVAADGNGSVYISGWTDDDLAGTSAGGRDAFVAKFSEVDRTCDFDGNELCGISDLNAMLAIGPVSPGVSATGNEDFDLTGDGVIDNADVDEWLATAATDNGLGSPYKRGDATLDGTVDGQDFIRWNESKFTSSLLWDSGDFTGDGIVDGRDFLKWNNNKFTSSDGLAAVPEPSAPLIFLLGLFLIKARESAA